MEAFRKAAENGDTTAVEALLADDVVFHSPVAYKPYSGKPITAAILRGVLRVFEGIEYVRVTASADGRDHVLEFRTTVNGKDVNGADFLHLNEAGQIDDLKVMVRPLSAAQALAEAMAAQFDQIQREATAG